MQQQKKNNSSQPNLPTPAAPKKSQAIKIEQKGNKMVYTFDRRIIFQVDNNYKVNQIIGRGVYGVVAEGQNTLTNQKVAIKLIKQLFRDPGQAKRQLRQIKILKFLKHKNIVSLLDIMKIENKNKYNQVYLVLEYMQYNLRKFIHSKNQISNNMIKFILYQILDGLQHMHSAQIIHRDLKPENILINSKLQLKIADMNLARKQDDNPTRYVVTRPYRALEVFLCSKYYTKSIDIWSVGCIFAELIGRTVIFQGKDYLDQLKRFVAILGKPNLDYYTDVDQSLKQSFMTLINQIPDRNKIDWKTLFPNADTQALDLLDHMLQYDPKKRFTAEQCLNHPFLKQLRQKNKITRCQNPIDFKFDEIPMDIKVIRKSIYDQAKAYHPSDPQLQSQQQQQQEIEQVVQKSSQFQNLNENNEKQLRQQQLQTLQRPRPESLLEKQKQQNMEQNQSEDCKKQLNLGAPKKKTKIE